MSAAMQNEGPPMPEEDELNPLPQPETKIEDDNKENEVVVAQQPQPTQIVAAAPPVAAPPARAYDVQKNDSLDTDVDYADLNFDLAADENDPECARNLEIIKNNTPTTELEHALKSELDRQLAHNDKLIKECTKLRSFIAKRKQTYKRKRKDEGAPRKKLSGYNIFIRERFARLAKENEEAMKSADPGAEMKRVPPASNIVSSGHAWSQLSDEEKARYNAMAKPDEDRFQKEAATYQAPDRLTNRKRNKTGYNVFFSQHVLKLKTCEGGIPSERGSVARVVGDAWKKMSADEKDEYERLADRQNEMEPSGDNPQQQHQQKDHPVQELRDGDGGEIYQQHSHEHENENDPHGEPQDVEMPPPPEEHHHHHLPPPPGPPGYPGPPPGPPPPHIMEGHPPPPPGMEDGMVGGPPPPPEGPDPNAIGPPPPMPPGMPHPPYPPPPDGYFPPPGPGGGPPPVIHQPPAGYDPATGYMMPPPFDPFYPPPYPPGVGMPPPPPGAMPPPPPGVEGMPPPGPYGPPPPNYQGPPPPYVG